MQIGIITFHSALNYGALLQTYALQEYCKSLGHTVMIIDFQPANKFQGRFSDIPIIKSISKLVSKIRHQRRKNYFYRGAELGKLLNLSNRYKSFEQLKRNPPKVDALICGSDQIWNSNCLRNCKQNTIEAYFLNFGPEDVIKIAYSASFGTDHINQLYINQYFPLLKKYNSISLREPFCQKILEQNEIPSCWTCDPTLLHGPDFYNKLIPKGLETDLGIFIFSLNKPLSQSELNIIRRNHAKVHTFSFGGKLEFPTVGEWLSNIKNCNGVITDSYHGIVFSIIYKKPFLSVLNKGTDEGRNTRIFALLNKIGLEHHAVEDLNNENILLLSNSSIDWNIVNLKLLQFINSSKSYLNTALGD